MIATVFQRPVGKMLPQVTLFYKLCWVCQWPNLYDTLYILQGNTQGSVLKNGHTALFYKMKAFYEMSNSVMVKKVQ